jgi:hypothetical protein
MWANERKLIIMAILFAAAIAWWIWPSDVLKSQPAAKPTYAELRFANRFPEFGNNFRVERYSHFFNTLEQCEQAKARMENPANNPNLFWAKCKPLQ